MSDWTGTHSVWGSLEAGLDLEMPEAPGMFYKDRLSRLFHGDPDGRAEMTKPRALAVLRVMARLGWDIVWSCALCHPGCLSRVSARPSAGHADSRPSGLA